MERIKSPHNQYGPSITFFRDDVEEILAILNDACESVTISDRHHTYASLDELIELKGPRPREILLHGSSPYVHVDIKPLTSLPLHVFAMDTDDAEISFFRIQQYLGTRARKYDVPKGPPWTFAGLGVLTGAISLRRPDLIPVWIPLTLYSAGLVLSIIAVVSHGLFTRIRLERRYKATTFWSRNSERLIVGFIGVLLGALGKELASWVVKMLK